MANFTARATRLLNAVEKYSKNCKGWDASYLIPHIKITSAGNGVMEGTFEVTEDKCNAASTLHGGFTATIIDYFACYSLMQHPKGALAWTMSMSTTFLGGPKIGDIVKIRAEPLLLNQKRAVMMCTMTKVKNNAPVAQGSVEFLFPEPPVTFMEKLPYNPVDKD